MLGFKSKTEDHTANVRNAAKKTTFENLRHAIASMRRDAVKTIKRRKDPEKASPEGTPPFTHTGLAKVALRWDVSGDSAIMGFTFSKMGRVGETHEKGGREEGRKYPERPTVGPALERSVARFHSDWRSSIS